MDKIKSILRFAMRMEKDAGDFYEYYMDKAVSEETGKIFAELAKIEKQHYNIIKAKFDELGYSEPPAAISWVVDENFKARDPHILADNSDMLQGMEGEATDISILRTAYLIESDFEHFYKKASELVQEPEVKKFLSGLSLWESKHKDIFHQKYHEILEKKWSDIKVLFE